MTTRRTFLHTLAAGLLAAPVAADAQSAARAGAGLEITAAARQKTQTKDERIVLLQTDARPSFL